jgi:N-acetyl-gamma-glutamyl-phosphate reductase
MKQPHQQIKAGIVGGSGYTGMELLRLLNKHPCVEIVFATSEQKKGTPLVPQFPEEESQLPDRWVSVHDLTFPVQVDVVFLCLSHGQSMDWAARFLENGVRIIDLSADFRFPNPETFRHWYGIAHRSAPLLKRSVYGLPEWYRNSIRQASIIGNPGCYPTAVLLCLLPLARYNLLERDAPIWIDAKSGVTGTGKAPSSRNHFVTVNENVLPYYPGRTHRHVGEMTDVLQQYAPAGWKGNLIFVPQVLPMARGILANLYLTLSKRVTRTEVCELFEETYRDEFFVRFLGEKIPDLHRVQHTNYCDIGFHLLEDGRHLILFSALDNLLKGASGQAIQNMNLLFGLHESTGLVT